MLRRLNHRFNYLLITGLLLIMSNATHANEIWIDVRTTDEFNAGHIEGAAHIPYEEIAARISEITTDKNAKIHLYCRSGNRSGIAQQTLKQLDLPTPSMKVVTNPFCNDQHSHSDQN